MSFLSNIVAKIRDTRFEGIPRPSKIQKPSLSNFVRNTCVPKWYAVFSDCVHGGFHERLDENFQPLPLGYKRLITQCRQLYIYTHADQGSGRYLSKLQGKYEFIRDHYLNRETGGWAFSVAEDGSPADPSLDLYAQAFLILSLSLYAKKSGNQEAARLSAATLALIDKHFRIDGHPGFYEALNADLTPKDAMRRQNPHMHLFEACLFAYDMSRDQAYLDMAHELYGLFTKYFFDQKSGTLGEFFNDDLSPHKTDGHRVEAGHHFEWVWLLDYYRRFAPENAEEAFSYMEKLYDWGVSEGYDPIYGGIFDQTNRQGKMLKTSKRIWPLCEAIKAHRAMRPYQPRALVHLETTKEILKKHYILKNSAWVESWNRNFTHKTVDYLPGTSVYHL